MKDVYELVNDAKDILDSLNIPYGDIVSVKVNTRAVKRLGQCTWHKRAGNFSIEIKYELLTDDVPYDTAMNTVIHEVLHAHPDRMSHKGEWKRCAQLINKKYPQYNITRCATREEENIETVVSEPKYIITCLNCGTVNKYYRYSKVVSIIEKQPIHSRCMCNRCGCDSFIFTWNI